MTAFKIHYTHTLVNHARTLGHSLYGTQTHILSLSHTHTHTHTHILSLTHSHTHTHTYSHTHTHTHSRLIISPLPC